MNEQNATDSPAAVSPLKKIAEKLGPGLMTAAVVLGPGSISVISSTGSSLGNRLLWLVALCGIFMLTYTILSAKLGSNCKSSFLSAIAERYGRWLSVIIGLSAFVVCAGFQSGNAVGVGMSLNAVIGLPRWLWSVAFTAMAILFLHVFKGLYKALERLLVVLVIIMILAFAANLAVSSPDWGSIGTGLVPSKIGPGNLTKLAAIVATSFSVMAALFQSYLVRAKGWGPDETRRGMQDSTIGIVALSMISMMVMITSATVLGSRGITVSNAADMALQLEPLLGSWAKWLFCLGLWAASFSSFVGNAILGGTLLSDGLGVGDTIGSKPSRWIATVIMLVGMSVAVASEKFSPVGVIIAAQAATVIAVPVACAMILWMSNRKDILGSRKPAWWVNIIALAGFVTVSLMAIRTVSSLIARF